jgi:Flp pilus assembly protein TadD
MGKPVGAGAALLLVAALGGCAGAGSSEGTFSGEMVDSSLAAAATNAEAAGDPRTAASHYSTLHRRHPSNPRYAARLARTLRLAGESRQALTFLEGFLDKEKKTPELLIELGKSYLTADRLNLAAQVLTEAIQAAPESWEAHSTLGVVHDYQGRHADALKAYEAALKISPNNPSILNNLALSQAVSGDLSTAIATLEKANDQPKASPQVRQNLALLLAIKGDAAAAERFARKDLPPEAVRNNLRFFRALADSVKAY